MLKWMRDNCICGFNLVNVEPKPTEKGFNSLGQPIWTDFCPSCGNGYEVGERNETKKVGHPEPDKTYTDGEEIAELRRKEPIDSLIEEAEKITDGILTPVEEAPMVSEAKDRFIPEGYYFCTKCNMNHSLKSKIGKKHESHKGG